MSHFNCQGMLFTLLDYKNSFFLLMFWFQWLPNTTFITPTQLTSIISDLCQHLALILFNCSKSYFVCLHIDHVTTLLSYPLQLPFLVQIFITSYPNFYNVSYMPIWIILLTLELIVFTIHWLLHVNFWAM